MMGASLLSLPNLVQRLGLIQIIILYISGVAIQGVMYYILVKAAGYTNSRSYREIVANVLTKTDSIFLDIMISIQYYGITTAYIIIASQNYVSLIFQLADYKMNTYLTKLIVAFVIFLLTLLKNLK